MVLSNVSTVTTATIPYIRGTSETIARVLQPYNIRVALKPITTLRRLLTNVKDKDKPEDTQGAVYKIKYCDCQASYIGETGRNLSTRLTEHKRATRNGDVNNHIAEHHLRCFDTVFQTPYRYFSIALKVIFPCPIAVKFSLVIGYGLKFVKM